MQALESTVVLERVRAFRDAVGPHVDLCLELHRRLTPAEAEAFADVIVEGDALKEPPTITPVPEPEADGELFAPPSSIGEPSVPRRSLSAGDDDQPLDGHLVEAQHRGHGLAAQIHVARGPHEHDLGRPGAGTHVGHLCPRKQVR